MSKYKLTREQESQGFRIEEGEYNIFLYDKDNNRWNLALYAIEQAIEASKSLRNCKNCTNCEECVNCLNCIDCKRCVDCKNLQNCIELVDFIEEVREVLGD
ncbi:hypothetical protein NCR96_08765 [Helicobacter sp. 14348-15]|uniref:hypothetical protein n=1 Tax=Helicobacter TaxID=209 RepID=UPI001F59A595|nr:MULTISPECIES: hypothetical protein [Helicobacter]MCI2236821.1 hypothetical protein [Helicobacter sp. CaF467b]MCL9821823.1 hypothetical protein [Helicobacter colisuis]